MQQPRFADAVCAAAYVCALVVLCGRTQNILAYPGSDVVGDGLGQQLASPALGQHAALVTHRHRQPLPRQHSTVQRSAAAAPAAGEARAPAAAAATSAAAEAQEAFPLNLLGSFAGSFLTAQRQANSLFERVPSWLPFAAASAAMVAAAVGLGLHSAKLDEQRAARALAARAAPAATVVQVETSKSPMNLLAAPALAKVPPATAPQRAAFEVAASPVAPTIAKVEPKPALPARPAQPAKPLTPVAANVKAPPPMPTSVMLSSAAQSQGSGDLWWARGLANGASAGLRAAADLVPQAEMALERSAPVLEGSLQKVAGGNADEALPAVGKAIGHVAGSAARTGLQVLSGGLGFAAEGLPMAGQVANFAVDAAMPSVQAGAHFSAEAARSMAGEMDATGAQQVLPGVLNAAASGLDMFASGAPAAKKAFAYAANKAMPVVQNFLRVSSQVSADAARVQAPSDEQIANSLRSVNVDPDHLATQAQNVLRQAATTVTQRMQ